MNIDKSNGSPFQQIKIIYYSLAAGQIMFFAISLFVVTSKSVDPNETLINIFNILVPIFTLGSLIVSRTLYKKSVDKEKSVGSLIDKINSYRKNNIIKWALIEGATFFTIVAFILTADYLYAVVIVIILLYFFVNMPSQERFKIEYELSNDEFDRLISL